MKLRLFTLRNTHTGKTSGEFFPSKPEAKAARDAMNEAGTTAAVKVWVVTPGPDHRSYKG